MAQKFKKKPVVIVKFFKQIIMAKYLKTENSMLLEDGSKVPCPPQHSFVEGVTYEEGKDYEIGYGDGETFVTNPKHPEAFKHLIAIPINKESEDDMWFSVKQIFDKWLKNPEPDYKSSVRELKQSFSISRKQK